jgi:glucose dehydrogenase
LGNATDTGPLGLASHLPLPIGTMTIGGSLTTRSGLIFIAATLEQAFRAFDIRDGRKLWSVRLPQSAYATPMSYLGPRSGKQFVVIASGGNAISAVGPGEFVIAYTLP